VKKLKSKIIVPRKGVDKKSVDLIVKSHKLLFKMFTCRMLAERSKIEYTTVCAHKTRLKSSGEAAAKYCKIKEVAAAGFTKELLRPDIKEWGDCK